MDITVTIKTDKKLEAVLNRIAEALTAPKETGGCCKEPDPAAELLERMEAEKKPEPKPEPKEEPAPAPENEETYTIDDMRKALSQFTKGDAAKRKQAVQAIGKFTESAKLPDMDPKDYPALIAELAAL